MSTATTKKVPYHRKPDELSVEEWQSALRKQFAVEQKFDITNIGEHAVFSDFEVYNPKSRNTYKVAIRDGSLSNNFCSCPDFAVNNLGTCKHIEYVLHSLLKYKKYQKIYQKPPKASYASLSIDYNNKQQVWLKKPDKSTTFELETAFFDPEGYLLPEKMNELDVFIENNANASTELKIYPDVFEQINQQRKELDRLKIADKIFPEGIESPVFNGLINASLYNYQKAGVMKIFRTGRVLLADEMGLGKTIQAIAAVELFARYLDVSKVLIICPTSLKFQWKREIDKFADRRSLIVEGLIHKRTDLYKEESFFKIMSYGVAKNDLEYILEWNPDLVIIDEAQRIKNWKTKTAQIIKRIQSEYTIVLTGTPLENRIDELHSIVEYVDRYKLGPLYKFLDNHQRLDEYGKLSGYKNLRSINKTIEPLLIRRTKKEIADQLPGRMDKNFFVEMTEKQKKYHLDYYEVVCQMVNRWVSKGYLTDEEREKLLTGLNCMRMVSDNTYILNQKLKEGDKVKDITKLVKELTENRDNKIVIFSQWKRMFELIVDELDKLGLSFVYLNGDISAQQRNDIIERFRKDKKIQVFLSTDAGGVGVNLQTANILINVDLPWNPAVLEQRIARIYRLGQKKKIGVFNFIAKYSIEHRILHLLDFKKSVFDGVIEEEGADEVSMESFMSSVKALTDVDMDGNQRTEVYQSYKPGHSGYKDDLANEINLRVLGEEKKEQSLDNNSPQNESIKGQNTAQKKLSKKSGIFSKLTNKIKSVFSKVFGR